MGRRKIEIQPITHERNRSVTFLKRKNGLFKKAYELGVLCSVDVAVIIFEERQGHHVKLYQYCSTDAHNMVTRHLRFDGEKDSRGPADFNNNKAQEAADDDDDEADDDESARQTKRPPAGKPPPQQPPKIKVDISDSNSMPARALQPTTSDMSMTIDLGSRSSRVSPVNNGSSLPISGERHSTSAPTDMRSMPMGNKRPRLDEAHLNGNGAHSHSMHGAMAANSNTPVYPYRLEVDMNQYASPSPVAPLPHPHAATSHSPVNMMYPSANMLQNSPSAFLQQFEQHPQQSLRSVSFPPPASYAQHPAMYLPRQTHQQSLGVDLLDSMADHGGGHHAQQQAFPSFDWPVHAQHQQQQQHMSHEQVPNQGMFQMPTHARAASNSVSSTRSVSYALAPSVSSSGHASPAGGVGHKRARDEDGEFALDGGGGGHALGLAHAHAEQNGRRSASGDRAPG